MQIRFVVVSMTIVLFGSACGLKGPLYRPEDRQQASQPAPGEATNTPKPRRPRPAPQVQKEDRGDPATETSAPVTPVDPERAPDVADPVQSMPADESR